jgi:hypothetical protein
MVAGGIAHTIDAVTFRQGAGEKISLRNDKPATVVQGGITWSL